MPYYANKPRKNNNFLTLWYEYPGDSLMVENISIPESRKLFYFLYLYTSTLGVSWSVVLVIVALYLRD